VAWSCGFQVIDNAKEAGGLIILVTHDREDDWWWREAGRTLGPRPESLDETDRKAGVQLWTYPAARLLEHAAKHLERKVRTGAIVEAWMVAETDEEGGRATALVEREVEEYLLDLLSHEPPLLESQRGELVRKFVRERWKEALREEDAAAREAAEYARTTPLSATEDVEPTDGAGMSAAFKRRREATAVRQAWSSKYDDLVSGSGRAT